MLHPEFMIFSLLDLYVTISNEDRINIVNLKEAFELLTLKFIMMEDITLNFNFDLILYNLCEKYSNCLTMDDEDLVINDLEELFTELTQDINMDDLDFTIDEYIHNINIYNALDLSIPIDENKEYFNYCNLIMQIYLKIARKEYEGNTKLIPFLTIYLQDTITKFNNALNEFDSDMLLKLKMCLANANTCLLDSDGYFTNSGWNIALFSENPTQMQKLKYERLEYASSLLDYRFSIDELMEDDEEPINVSYTSEMSIFLTYYLIYLNNYLKDVTDPKLKEHLTIKKYLLLSMPELQEAETYFLNNYTIDNLPFPLLDPEIISITSFEVLLERVLECAMDLDYSNDDIAKNSYLETKLILNSLFIKCFLELSLNDNYKNDIINVIKNSRYYSLPAYYSETISIINNIIFSKEHNIQR